MLTRDQRGFSLLELILVLVIIGIILAAVTIGITDRRVDNLKIEMQRLQVLVTLAVDESLISNQELGLIINKEQYAFLTWSEEAEWQPMNSETARQFRPRNLDPELDMLIQVAGLYGIDNEDNRFFAETDDEDTENIIDDTTSQEANNTQKKLRPQVLILSSGEVTPFTIRLGFDDDNPVYIELKVDAYGQAELSKPVYEPMILDWTIQ